MNSGIVANWSKAPPPVPWVIIGISLVSLLVISAYSFLSPIQQQIMIDVVGAVPGNTSAMLSNLDDQWPGRSGMALVFSLFIHSSWLHLVGNLAYLWVFGIKVEQKLGTLFMGGVFFLGGALSHVMVAIRIPELTTPIVGASGAVSAVVGAYLGLFPSSRIGLFLPLGLYLQFARVPALLVIGSWFTLQLVYSAFGPITGAVAWWTHLAGFVIGLMFAMLARAIAQFRF